MTDLISVFLAVFCGLGAFAVARYAAYKELTKYSEIQDVTAHLSMIRAAIKKTGMLEHHILGSPFRQIDQELLYCTMKLKSIKEKNGSRTGRITFGRNRSNGVGDPESDGALEEHERD